MYNMQCNFKADDKVVHVLFINSYENEIITIFMALLAIHYLFYN